VETAKINVLSLFDGMSCGQIALDQSGIEVDKYYASDREKQNDRQWVDSSHN
jgi:hypothetical protein